MAKPPTFIAFYASDWIAGTRILSAFERMAYMDLLALIYEAGGPVEHDNRRLARFSGVTAAVFKKAVDGLVAQGKITIEGGMISNARALVEIEKANARSDNAQAAINARWAKTGENRDPKPSKLHENATPTPSEKPSGINETAIPANVSGITNQTQTQTQKVSREVRAPAASTSTGPRLEDFVSQEAARDYRAHRVALKAKLTPGAEKGICRELTKILAMGLDPTEALETAAARGWRAVKAEWIVNDKTKDAGHGQQPRGPQARAEIASDKANDFWASYDAQADGDPFRAGDFGGAERGPDDPWRDSGDSEGILEGVVLRPAFVRR